MLVPFSVFSSFWYFLFLFGKKISSWVVLLSRVCTLGRLLACCMVAMTALRCDMIAS